MELCSVPDLLVAYPIVVNLAKLIKEVIVILYYGLSLLLFELASHLTEQTLLLLLQLERLK